MLVGVSLSSKYCRVKILVFYFPPLQSARDYFEEHSQSKKLNSSLPSEKPVVARGKHRGRRPEWKTPQPARVSVRACVPTVKAD